MMPGDSFFDNLGSPPKPTIDMRSNIYGLADENVIGSKMEGEI
jgi:hypothetical protein